MYMLFNVAMDRVRVALASSVSCTVHSRTHTLQGCNTVTGSGNQTRSCACCMQFTCVRSYVYIYIFVYGRGVRVPLGRLLSSMHCSYGMHSLHVTFTIISISLQLYSYSRFYLKK